VAVPGLLLAGFGTVHPDGLHAGNAQWWTTLHVLLLPLFPLLAAAQWVLLTPAPRLPRWSGRLAAYGYAAFYTGLDAVAGIAAGTVEEASGGTTTLTSRLFEIGDTLGYLGAWCFLVGNVCVVAGVAWRARWRVVPGAVLLLLASVSFLDSHLFSPRGVYTMIGIAVGMGLLSWAGTTSSSRATTDPASTPDMRRTA
jgi:hypothetical protein